MAELMTVGRLGHARTIDYDFTDDGGRRVHRQGLDVYLIGQQFEGMPTCVKVNHPADCETIRKAGQGATVQLTLAGDPDRKGRYEVVPGGVAVVANSNGEPVKG